VPTFLFYLVSAIVVFFFSGVMAMAGLGAAGSIVGSRLMTTRLNSTQLKRIIGVLLWLIAAKMIFDLL
jgi:uncharacterized membrane protein YfcA